MRRGPAVTLPGDPALAEAARLLVTPAPAVSEGELAGIARGQYGVDVEVAPLAGERDRNALLRTADGRRFVLKLCNAADDEAARDVQVRLLDHVAGADPSLPVPRLVRTREGAAVFAAEGPDGAVHHGFLVTHLDAVAALPGPTPSGDPAELGHLVARLGRALASFEHPGIDRVLLWDMMHCPRLLPLCGLIADEGRREAVRTVLHRFAETTGPAVAALRRQAIHNDLSVSNVLVDPADPRRIAGLIDFGDAVRAPLVCEIAVAASYRMSADGDPFADLPPLLAGYATVTPLREAEVAHLFDLILARLAMRVLIPVWRAELFPDNRDYIMRSNRYAAALLDRLAALAPGQGRDAVLAAWERGR